jgi:hypothetical protein
LQGLVCSRIALGGIVIFFQFCELASLLMRKRPSMKRIMPVVAFVCAAYAVPALGADETLLCNLVKKVPTGETISFQQKYDIDFDTGSLISSENWGSGWQESGHSQLVEADESRITIADTDRMYIYIDRETGNLSGSVLKDFKKLEETGNTANYMKGTTFRGSCKKEDTKPKHIIL